MKPLRVALSGSGFKFPAHVGALKAILDSGYTPIELAGTSGGSIIATLFAAGMDIETMTELSMTKDWSEMLTFNIISLFSKMGYCTGKTLEDWINNETKSLTFNDLKIDLTIVASDISNAIPFVFNKNLTPNCPISLASRASASIPFAYAPIQFSKSLLMDGGMVNNIPIDELKLDSVPCIGIQLVSNVSSWKPGVYTLFSVLPRIIDLMMNSNDSAHIEIAKNKGAKIAFVETGYASSLDKNMSKDIRQRLYNDGYNNTITLLKTIN